MRSEIGLLLLGLLVLSQCRPSPPLNQEEVLDSLERNYSQDWEKVTVDSQLLIRGEDYLIDQDIEGVLPELQADFRNYRRRITRRKRAQRTYLGEKEYLLITYTRSDVSDILYVLVWDFKSLTIIGYFELAMA